jgi:protein TonB
MPNSGRTARTLVVAFIVSLALHLALAPFLRSIPQARAEKPRRPEVISLDEPRVPRPTPKPTMPPTPKPEQIPRVARTALPARPRRAALLRAPRRPAIRAPHAVAVAPGAQVEPPGQTGPPGPGTNGAGPANGGVGVGPGTAPVARPPTEAPAPSPAAVPVPSCAQPQVAARVVDTVEPRVPDVAREEHAVGVANVRVDLDERGAVLGVTVAKSAGNVALDAAALDAARRSTYAAAIVDCRPEGGSYLFRVEFDDG